MSLFHRLSPLFFILVIIGFGTAGYYYWQNQKLQKENQTLKAVSIFSQKTNQDDFKNIIEDVSKLIDLPKGEDPTVATISDIDRLKDQIFFQKAKNGDKVLIFTKSKKAILYDPEAKKILDVGPISMATSSSQQTSLSATEQKMSPKVVLLNGTTTVGLTGKVESQLKKDYPELEIIDRDNAKSKSYNKTVIVPLKESSKDIAGQLAKTFDAEISTLPSGETERSEADIIIILGKDKI